MSDIADLVAAVIVDYHAGESLNDCVASLRRNGVTDIVLVENGEPGSMTSIVRDPAVRMVTPALNLGYGRGVNRGAAATTDTPYLLVSNPDVVVHDGAVSALVEVLESDPQCAVVGPKILRPDGSVYPSHRVFPNMALAAAHALLAPLWPGNPATKKYRSTHVDGTVDWVSGACFIIRREAFEQVGGFDERYFMFAEDMALCYAVGQRGYRVRNVDAAVVTHVEGLSRQSATRSMVWAHHRSAMRFETQRATGWRKLLLPVAAAVLGTRMVLVLVIKRQK